MRFVDIPLGRHSNLKIIFSGQIRRKFRNFRLGLCGVRKRTRYQTILSDRIYQVVYMRWRWMPFVDFLYTKNLDQKFIIHTSDPMPLKMYIEYEFWKWKNVGFQTKPFVMAMAQKYKIDEDTIIEHCNDVMLEMQEKNKLNNENTA